MPHGRRREDVQQRTLVLDAVQLGAQRFALHAAARRLERACCLNILRQVVLRALHQRFDAIEHVVERCIARWLCGGSGRLHRLLARRAGQASGAHAHRPVAVFSPGRDLVAEIFIADRRK